MSEARQVFMWCDRILGNIAAWGAMDAARIDWVDISWQECGRVLQKRSRGGRTVRVLLAPGQRVGHGDLLFDESGIAIAVNVIPCEVAVVDSTDPVLAFELGNLHCPMEIAGAQIIFIEDGPALAAVEKLGYRWTREQRRFAPLATIASPTFALSSSFAIKSKAAL
jgi:urease accessory protein UreE